MPSIADVVKETILDINPNVLFDEPVSSKQICFVLDTSGSTACPYREGFTVLDREIICVKNYVIENPNNDYYLYSFASYSTYHGKLDCSNFPTNFERGGTDTCNPLNKIYENIHTQPFDKIIIVTDGQTNSNEQYMKNVVDNLKKHNVAIETIVVCATNQNMEIIDGQEENYLAGMDLIRMVGNNINKLLIYNNFHDENPFDAINNSTINKNYVSFMGIPVPCFIPLFIETFINKFAITPNVDYSNLCVMLCEIGKLFSILFHEFPQNNQLLLHVCKMVNCVVECEDAMDIIKYGFDCSKSNKPIILTNFQNHVKEATTKRGEFKDAVALLKKSGTTLGAKQKISIPTYNFPFCLIDVGGIIETKQRLFDFPNSITEFGNIMFPFNPTAEQGQAIRIGLRKMCELLKFPDAHHSPSVPFYMLNMMSIMFLLGNDLNTEHMKQLQKFAIIQTSVEVMVDKNSYDGQGCYAHWKNGNSIKIHYSSANTHISLFEDKMINPLNLPETMWWAVMMSMLGLFDEQKAIYENFLRELRCNTKDAFLQYFKCNYANKVSGHFVLETFKHVEKSLFTLDEFADGEQLYVLNEHLSQQSNSTVWSPLCANSLCKTQTVYSLDEINNYVLTKGCVWCHFIPTMANFTKVVSGNNPQKVLKNMEANKQKIQFYNNKYSNSLSYSLKPVVQVAPTIYKINLIGVNGCGKASTVDVMKTYFDNKGYKYFVINDLSVKREFNKFMKMECDTKIIIAESDNKTFAGIGENGFKLLSFYPNLNVGNLKQFASYEKWALHNVINGVDADVSKLIELHNRDATVIANSLNVKRAFVPENLTKTQFLNMYATVIGEYAKFLETYGTEQVVARFLDKNVKFL